MGVVERILTRYKDTAIGRILADIEANADPTNVGLGLLLLELSENTIETLNHFIERIARDTERDAGVHDESIFIGNKSAGLTIHCNERIDIDAELRLRSHCRLRKYATKSERWFGIAIQPERRAFRFAVKLEYPWRAEEEIEKRVQALSAGVPAARLRAIQRNRRPPGHNDPCPCGSGKKYKRCCAR